MTQGEAETVLAARLKDCAEATYPRPILENILEVTAEQINKHSGAAPLTAAELGIELRHGLQSPHLGGNSIYFKPETHVEAMDSYHMPFSTTVLAVGTPEKNPVRVVLHAPIPIPETVTSQLKAAFASEWHVPTQVFGAFQSAARDPLTQLANRNGIEYFLEYHAFNNGSQQRAQPAVAAVLVIDVDKFKLVNDTYGHATGDRVLKFVGAAIEQSIRAEVPNDNDWIAGRDGGDEFVAAIRYTSIDQMERIVNNLENRVGTPVASNHRTGNRSKQYILEPTPGLSLSTGYSIFSTEGWRPSEFHMHVNRIKDEADTHMYRRKQIKQQASLDSTLDTQLGTA